MRSPVRRVKIELTPSRASGASDNGFAGGLGSAIEQQIDAYIQRPEIGLEFDPFRETDAGRDEHIIDYLVDGDTFSPLWKRQHTVLYADPGAGKSAQRTRLAYLCRVGWDGRRILAVTLMAPNPRDVGLPADQKQFTVEALRAVAGSLLLQILYRPHEYLERSSETQQKIVALLRKDLVWDLSFVCDQVADRGELVPVIRLVDPTARRLPAQPSAETLRSLCEQLKATQPSLEPPEEVLARWRDWVELIIKDLQFEAIFLLVDGVDGYPETANEPEKGADLVQPLVESDALWRDLPVFVKLFVPASYREALERRSPVLLTENCERVSISWKSEALIALLQQRLRVASRGGFSSFDAITTPGLKRVEQQIVHALRDPLPREAVRLAEALLIAHVRRRGPQGLLEPEDLEQAIAHEGRP
ncbi:MAG: hypothetical protein Kow0047_06780 [Anaerolineae bacterium]